MRVIRTIADLEEGTRELLAREPRFLPIAQAGLPPLRRAPGGFATLAEIIVEQMISLKASRAIVARLRSAFDLFDPAAIGCASHQDLQGIGLSGAKAKAIKALAQAVTEGRLNFGEFEQLEDSKVRAKLMAFPGVGSWSAELYLLTALGRCDAWPCSDVALQVAAQSLFGLGQRPGVRDMDLLARPWQPWRAVAARLLWAHYRRVNRIAPDS